MKIKIRLFYSQLFLATVHVHCITTLHLHKNSLQKVKKKFVLEKKINGTPQHPENEMVAAHKLNSNNCFVQFHSISQEIITCTSHTFFTP